MRLTIRGSAIMTDGGKSYYIPGEFPVSGHLVACPKCGKKIVIEIPLCGVSHNLGVFAHCAGCMEVNEKFKNEFPDIAKQIEEFCGDGI